MRFAVRCLAILCALPAVSARADTAPPTIPTDVKGVDGVKTYLTQNLAKMDTACADFKTAATVYDNLCTNAGGPQAAANSKPQDVADLIRQMRDAYQRIDSYGYEYIEGIVAGVPSLMKYDNQLDAGVPAKAAEVQDNVADVVIQAGDLKIDHEGSLNNFLIEPTVFGTNERFTSGKATLPGFEKPVGLPNPKLTVALADYAIENYAKLTADAKAWQPTDRDCFHVLANMTPTLADYFDDWKESKKNGYAIGGRFVAVSRISDMRGIMSSTRLTWQAVADQVKAKNAGLADTVTSGYDQIITFIDVIEAREAKKPLQVETIDALGAQAKEKADKLTVQASEAAAVLNIDVNAK